MPTTILEVIALQVVVTEHKTIKDIILIGFKFCCLKKCSY